MCAIKSTASLLDKLRSNFVCLIDIMQINYIEKKKQNNLECNLTMLKKKTNQAEMECN